ncbi:hypothetical protein [Endozoicomonas sp. SESOKO2]|uniref:hypothetical protein n=1 Tax=Endozoicomonas sp. SESOKO2 TaxID=2828743 RepID=UPI0021484F07|nr:hypothetical protein [Endozoicomonas sp. SESOKO2]
MAPQVLTARKQNNLKLSLFLKRAYLHLLILFWIAGLVQAWDGVAGQQSSSHPHQSQAMDSKENTPESTLPHPHLLEWQPPSMTTLEDQIKSRFYIQPSPESGYSGSVELTLTIQPFEQLVICAAHIQSKNNADIISLSEEFDPSTSGSIFYLTTKSWQLDITLIRPYRCSETLLNKYSYDVGQFILSTQPILALATARSQKEDKKTTENEPNKKGKGLNITGLQAGSKFDRTESGDGGGIFWPGDDNNQHWKPHWMALQSNTDWEISIGPILRLDWGWLTELTGDNPMHWLFGTWSGESDRRLRVNINGNQVSSLRLTPTQFNQLLKNLGSTQQVIRWLKPLLNGQAEFIEHLLDMSEGIEDHEKDIQAAIIVERIAAVIEQTDEFDLDFELKLLNEKQEIVRLEPEGTASEEIINEYMLQAPEASGVSDQLLQVARGGKSSVGPDAGAQANGIEDQQADSLPENTKKQSGHEERSRFSLPEPYTSNGLINSWTVKGMQVALMLGQNGLEAWVMSEDGKTIFIPPYDIVNIPKEIQNEICHLRGFCKGTWVDLHRLNDGSYKVYVHPRLRGGGPIGTTIGVALGGIQVAAGVTLTLRTGELEAAVGGALISSGIQDSIYSCKARDCDPGEYIKQSFIGGISGAVAGLCTSGALKVLGKFTGSITSGATLGNAATTGFLVVDDVLAGAVGGFSSNLAESATKAVINRENGTFFTKETARNAVIGAFSGGTAGGVGNILRGISSQATARVINACDEEMARSKPMKVIAGSLSGSVAGGATSAISRFSTNWLRGNDKLDGCGSAALVGAGIGFIIGGVNAHRAYSYYTKRELTPEERDCIDKSVAGYIQEMVNEKSKTEPFLFERNKEHKLRITKTNEIKVKVDSLNDRIYFEIPYHVFCRIYIRPIISLKLIPKFIRERKIWQEHTEFDMTLRTEVSLNHFCNTGKVNNYHYTFDTKPIIKPLGKLLGPKICVYGEAKEMIEEELESLFAQLESRSPEIISGIQGYIANSIPNQITFLDRKIILTKTSDGDYEFDSKTNQLVWNNPVKVQILSEKVIVGGVLQVRVSIHNVERNLEIDQIRLSIDDSTKLLLGKQDMSLFLPSLYTELEHQLNLIRKQILDRYFQR